MAQYEPIRDSFREFNRMIIDSERWDEEHALRKEDQEMRRISLMNGLEQQAFNNQMSRAEYNLRVAGQETAANNTAWSRMDSNRKFLLQEQEAGRSKAAHEESMKASKLDRLNKINEIKEENARIAQKPARQAAINDYILSDPYAALDSEAGEALGRLGQIDKEIKDLGDDNWLIPAKAKLRAEKNRIKGQISNIKDKTKGGTANPWYIEEMNKRANAAQSLGTELFLDQDAQSGQAMLDIAKGIRTQLAAEHEERTGGGKEIPGLMSEDQAHDNIRTDLEIKGLQGELLNPAVKPKITAVKGVYSRYVKNIAKIEGISEAQAREKAVTRAQEDVANLELGYFDTVEKIQQYNSRDIMNIMKKHYPKYKGSKNAKALRKFLLQKEKDFFKQDLRALTGDPRTPVYIPNIRMHQVVKGL